MNKPLCTGDVAVATKVAPPQRPWIERRNNALWLVGALWLECVIVWLIWYWGSFAHLDFRDPDDAMRLVQVRDFLAGQNWFDVSQHRVNPPVGGPMHWSRILDLPIAGIIVALRPLVGQAMAEIVACVTVPMLTLATLCFGMFAAVRTFLGIHRALLVVALLVTSFPILTQMSPLRIDHHAWQIAMAIAVLGGTIAANARLGGWIAGAAMAMWLHISGEALPYVVIAGGVLALRYAAQPDEWHRLIGFTVVLALGSAALLLATHGWAASLVPHCDSISPPYLVPLLVLVPAMLIGRTVAGDATLLRRIAPAAFGGIAAAAAFTAYAPQCLQGPFAALDPLVERYWLRGVMEGQPFWRQGSTTAAIVLIPPLFGLLGLGLAARTDKDSARRIQWLSILGLALGGFLVSALVLRAMSVAHMFSLIGNGWIIAYLYPKIAAMPRMAQRVIATVLLCALTPAGLAVFASSAVGGAKEPEATTDTVPCFDRTQIEALNNLPATTLFAPIDLGPAILQRTRHSVIGTAHHRNVAGIGTILRAYLASPHEAHAVVVSTPARYFLFCPALNEIKRYTKLAPQSLGASMIRGEVPAWLEPVTVPGVTQLKVYRVK